MIPPIAGAVGPLGPSEWTVSPVGGLGPSAQTGTTAAGGSGGFAGALSNAIDSLEQSQASATNAAQALATGKLSDPTQAITAIENASLEMQFASQIRTKVDEAVNTIFQTQP